MDRAYVVQGMGFGDEGKGSIVDFLVRKTGADLVVRFGGSQNCGHNVVTPSSLRHCFAQLGSGSFVPGVRTYLSRYMMIEPLAFLNEMDAFEYTAGFRPKVYIEQDCPVVTPWHWRINRLREILRGALRHGSTGMGLGEMRADMENGERVLRAADLVNPHGLWQILDHISGTKAEVLGHLAGRARDKGLNSECPISTSVPKAGLISEYRKFLERVEVVRNDSLSDIAGKSVVFEGHQGALLDEENGLEPYRTWSDCTFHNANKLLSGAGCPIVRIGVTRTFHTRHGAGPFPTEEDWPASWPSLSEEHNMTGPWQGHVRFGALDLPLLKYGANTLVGKDGIAVNHLDKCGPGGMIRLANRSTADRSQLWNGNGTPPEITTAHWETLGAIAPVLIESYGPTAADKKFSKHYEDLYGVSGLTGSEAIAGKGH